MSTIPKSASVQRKYPNHNIKLDGLFHHIFCASIPNPSACVRGGNVFLEKKKKSNVRPVVFPAITHHTLEEDLQRHEFGQVHIHVHVQVALVGFCAISRIHANILSRDTTIPGK